MKKKKMDKEAIVYAVLAIGCFFLFWWFITTFTPAKETTPGPWPVLQLLVQSFTEPIGTYTIIGHLMISLRRVLVGFGVATVLGIIFGIAMGTSDWARAIIKPIFELLRPIPPSPGFRWSSCSSAWAKRPSTSLPASARSPT